MPQNCPKDSIDRKMGFVERMFDRIFKGIREDPKSVFIFCLIAIIGVLIWMNMKTFDKYTASLETRLTENQEYSERMIEEVQRRMMPEMERQITKKVNEKAEKINKKIDSTQIGIEKIGEGIGDLLNEIR